MDNQQRTFLWLALAAVTFFIFSRWIEFNNPPAAVSVPNEMALIEATTDTVTEQHALINVKTDVLDIQIQALGGDIVRAGLITYPESLEQLNLPFRLLGTANALHPYTFISQTGLVRNPQSPNQANPTHQTAYFKAEQTNYVLKEGQDTLIVPLTWTDENGLNVNKTYTFKRGQFAIDFSQQLENTGDKLWTGTNYQQLLQSEPPKKGSFFMPASYTGSVYSMPSADITYQKESFSDLGTRHKNNNNIHLSGIGGWIAMIQHYFIAAWIPEQTQANLTYSNVIKGNATQADRYILGTRSQQEIILDAGQTHTYHSTLYLGPKIQEYLKPIADKLELTVDFGWLSKISNFLFNILVFIYGIVGNWGWAIVLLTVFVKACLFWFSAKGFQSMAKMRKFAPELQRLKEQYGDDRQKLNQEMMALYRKEKINPMSGCWPMLIQIPIFIALYWMLMESVELRQAPWILWIHDLSVMDPYFILPLIMGATMMIQQRLNPAPADPLQAKIMTYMPIVFTFMFLWFPAGLVLYWIVNNTLSILQQWYITRRIENASQH